MKKVGTIINTAILLLPVSAMADTGSWPWWLIMGATFVLFITAIILWATSHKKSKGIMGLVSNTSVEDVLVWGVGAVIWYLAGKTACVIAWAAMAALLLLALLLRRK